MAFIKEPHSEAAHDKIILFNTPDHLFLDYGYMKAWCKHSYPTSQVVETTVFFTLFSVSVEVITLILQTGK